MAIWAIEILDFPIKNGDFPQFFASLPEGRGKGSTACHGSRPHRRRWTWSPTPPASSSRRWRSHCVTGRRPRTSNTVATSPRMRLDVWCLTCYMYFADGCLTSKVWCFRFSTCFNVLHYQIGIKLGTIGDLGLSRDAAILPGEYDDKPDDFEIAPSDLIHPYTVYCIHTLWLFNVAMENRWFSH